MSPDEYCQHKAAASGSSFYYSFLFLPAAQRQAITALYAFCREVDDTVDECSDADIARKKLDWWNTEISRSFAGLPQHPVGQALTTSINNFNLAEEYFHEIIDGMKMDIDQHRYTNFSDLSLYCYRVASVVGLLASEIFGFEDRHTTDYACQLGMAFQLTNILRDVREDALRNRIYIPQDELQRFDVSEQDILQGNMHNNMRKLLKFQADRARQYYDKAINLLPAMDRFNQRSGLMMAAIYRSVLERIVHSDYDVYRQRISLSPIRKLWIAWQTNRKEKRRHSTYLKAAHSEQP